MHIGAYVFSRVKAFFPRSTFDTCVARHYGEQYVKTLTCRDQLLALMFGQLAYGESLRDVVACLSCHRAKLYHLGFHTILKVPTLAKANEKRSRKIYRDLCTALITEARTLYSKEPNIATDSSGACYTIDSTSIDLCLSLFPTLPFADTKGV